MNAANFDKRESKLSYLSSANGDSLYENMDEKLKLFLEKKIAQNKTNFDMQVKNMKPIVMDMAV